MNVLYGFYVTILKRCECCNFLCSPGIGLCAVDCTNLALLLRCYCVIERRIIPFIFVLEPHFPDMRKYIGENCFSNHCLYNLMQVLKIIGYSIFDKFPDYILFCQQ